MYSRSRNVIRPGICMTFFLLLAGTVSAADDYSVNIPPGGYAWSLFSETLEFGDFETVNAIAPGPLHGFSSVLPDTALQAIQLSEEWLQSDLAIKFTDLLYQEVYSEFPVAPAFADVNGDGLEDLVLESGSTFRAFTAPNWVEAAEFTGSVELTKTCDVDNDGRADSSFLSDQGVLTLYSGGSPFQTTGGYDISNVTGTALGDMEGDGLADLVVGTEAGNVLIFRNRGTVDIPCFQPFFSETQTFFPMNPGAFSSPALLLDDSLLVLAAGTRQNGLCYYSAETGDDSPVPGWSVLNTVENHSGYLNISPVVADLNGESIVICGTRNGILYEGVHSSDSLVLLNLPPVPGTYPNLAVTLVNGDEFPDLVAGTMEGGVYFLSGLDGWFHGNWAPVQGIPAIPSGAPAAWENGLVFGSADGTLRYFTRSAGGEWLDATEGSEFGLIDVGEYSTPLFFDVNNDGMEELVSGSSTGSLYFFEKSGSDSPFQENFSWTFQPNGGVSSIESYYSRYFTPYSVFCSPSGLSDVNSFAGEIINAHPGYRDEIAFCIANTPVDILRVMEDNGHADIFNLNAENLYDAAEGLSYVRLVDTEDGTSCELKTVDGWFEISRENYYRFVVHPRILFEVPGRIDATYWNSPWDSLAMSEREYLNYETDSLFGHSPDHVFWRQFIPSDSIRGRTLEQRMIEADTYEEAVVTLCNFQSHSQPGGMMSFGYQTNDLQPMTIYGKAYGSCGEQSILQTALCRAFFVPAYVVGCRGEDHQWNQYLDPASGKWNHWDVNYGISGIGGVWISGEGVDHEGKTISTISAFGPAGRVWSVTGDVLVPGGSGYMEGDSGYTRTATVDILVTDPSGQPVEGAMVLVKSHWNNANAITVFDYTDRAGLCVFDLGWEPNGGYTIDVISAYGSAGSMNIGFNEDNHYSVNYTVPYNIPQRQEISLVDSGSAGIPVVEKFYPVPYFTGSLYSIDSDENEDFVRNTDWVPWREMESTGTVFYMNGENFRSYRNGRSCNAAGYPFIPDEGDSCYAVLDNRNSMFTWIEYEVPHLMNLQAGNQPFSLENHTEDRVPVAGSGFNDNSFEFNQNGVHWINSYPDFEIHQDDPDDPLSSDLVIGPFKIPSGERSLSIGTSSDTANLDLDLFLFVDRNGNRAVDGMEELLTSSTSATSSEIVFITEPDTSAAYWIYLHGWQVEENSGLIHLGLSFQPDMITAHSLSPMGYQMILPQQFTFATVDSFSQGDIYLKSGETVIYPGKQEELWYFETDSPSNFFADGSVDLYLSNGELIESLQWNFSLDSIPPVFCIHSDGIDHRTMQGVIEVECEDDSLSGIQGVTITVDSLETVPMVLLGDSIWNCTLDFLPFSGETVSLEVCVVDSAGNETTENFQMSTVTRPEVVFSSIYPAETGTVYDHTPVLQVFADIENAVPGWTAEATVHGQVLEPLIDGEIIQFFVKEFLPDGEHRAKIQILAPDGEITGEYRWTFTVGTMSSTI